MTRFLKPATSLEQQIALLRQRGLHVPDEKKAKHYLDYIGYYRLSAYMKPFQTGTEHSFRVGTAFDDVLDLYVFDRHLRLHLMDGLERIEIALRSVMNNCLSSQFGAHWYLERGIFNSALDYPEMLERLRSEMGYQSRRKRETFISHYLNTYTEPPDPPGWMMIQTLSMGSVSRMFEDLQTEHQKPIALMFGMDHRVLISVLHSLAYVRNLCAHHSRLWNREFRIQPMIPKQLAKTFKGPSNRLGIVLILMEMILLQISPETAWKEGLDTLLQKHPKIHKKSMGLT